jgi:hypothetical protein
MAYVGGDSFSKMSHYPYVRKPKGINQQVNAKGALE